jgi:hypothetical protein
MKNDFPFFCCQLSEKKDLFWFRIMGYGLCFTKRKMLFSERTGATKSLPLFFGWRVRKTYNWWT